MPPLRRSDLAEDPLETFGEWYELARAEAPLADAMTLATNDPDSGPDARMVLLKGFGPQGFRFFTNVGSAKGAQLAAVPQAALVVYWRELDRQVRVRGAVERVPDDEADDYFASRPRDSRLGAWASPQSRPIDGREVLDERIAEAMDRFGDGPIERPSFWGGYRVVPLSIEFWQGQVARLHDRFRYERVEPGRPWSLTRLGP